VRAFRSFTPAYQARCPEGLFEDLFTPWGSGLGGSSGLGGPRVRGHVAGAKELRAGVKADQALDWNEEASREPVTRSLLGDSTRYSCVAPDQQPLVHAISRIGCIAAPDTLLYCLAFPGGKVDEHRP
jgi:hypothetical protein